MRTRKILSAQKVARWVCPLLPLPLLTVAQPERSVDFRFAPAHWQTIISLPDDWLKSFVSDQGALGYDNAPGPYARPLTEVSVGIKGAHLPVSRQYLEDPRVPIVTTIFQGKGQTMRQEAFALVPDGKQALCTPVKDTRVARIGGFNGCVSWTVPPQGTDPAFRNVAWGTNRPIRYAVKVTPGSRNVVALGICEAYKWAPGTRLVELRVEGGAPITVSTMKDTARNRPYVYVFHGFDEDGDGQLMIESHPSPKSPDPNAILNAFWVFPEDVSITEDALVRGELSSRAELCYSCGTELENPTPSIRVDAIRASFDGSDVTPTITVRTRREMQFDPSGELRSDGPFLLYSRPKALTARNNNGEWTLELPRGISEAEVIVVHGSADPEVPPLHAAREKSRAHWLSSTQIPQGRITVPDSGIQYLLDASIRTMYQVRDSVDGHTQFQPGPTVYRGLWAADAMLTDISVMTLGDSAGARDYLEAVLRHQLPSGQIRSLYPAISIPETPAALAAFCIHARSFGDSIWMKNEWRHIVKGMQWIEQMHRQTLSDASARNFGLMPPSFVDGGISDQTADYSSVWWTMIALERVIDAAQWLGIRDHVPEWRALLTNLAIAWRRSASSNLATDRYHTPYLPIVVGDTSRTSPQRGQFAFLCPFPYGWFFQQPDSLVQTIIHGNLAMLDSTQQEGLVSGSGWIQDGVWAWLGGVHGIAHDLAGNASRASDLLYAVANHATPTGTWVEEQSIKGKGERTGGDVSDAEAAATFILQVRRLLVRERIHNLEFLAGIPDAWLRPGSITELKQVFTEFGPVSFRLAISSDGSHADLHLSAIDGRGSNGKPVIFFEKLRRHGFSCADGSPLPVTLECQWQKSVALRFTLNSRKMHEEK
jgi:hypothetical protein